MKEFSKNVYTRLCPRYSIFYRRNNMKKKSGKTGKKNQPYRENLKGKIRIGREKVETREK